MGYLEIPLFQVIHGDLVSSVRSNNLRGGRYGVVRSVPPDSFGGFPTILRLGGIAAYGGY